MPYRNTDLYAALISGNADKGLAKKAADSTASIDRLDERIDGLANMVNQLKWMGGILFVILLGLLYFIAKLP